MVLVEKLYAHLGVAELYTNRGGGGEHIMSPLDFSKLWYFATRAYLSNKEDYILHKNVQGEGGKFLAYYVKRLDGKSAYKMMEKNKGRSLFID